MGDDSTDPEITLSSYREEWNVFSLPLTKGDICMGELKSKASFSESQEKGQHFWEPLTYPQSPPPLPHSQWSANPPGPLNPLLQYLFGNIWYGEEESEIQNQTLRTIFSYGFMEKKIRHPAFDLGPQPYTCFPLHLSRGSPWCPASPTTGTPNTGPCCLKNLYLICAHSHPPCTRPSCCAHGLRGRTWCVFQERTPWVVLVLSLFFILAILRSGFLTVALICISLMANDVEHGSCTSLSTLL